MQDLDFHKLPFKVSKWSAWSPAFKQNSDWISWASSLNHTDPLADSENPNPSVSFLPIGMRKKLSDLCKLVLYLAHNTLAEKNDVRIVMASRFGEIELTLELLEAIGRNETPSPMAFSRSVMNSSLGLFSIFQKNLKSSVCISAMENTFESGFFEALLQLHTYNRPVLFLYVEEKILEVYQPFVQDPPVSYGLGLLLEPGEMILNSDKPLDFLKSLIKADKG